MKKNEIKLSILDDTRYLPEDIEVSESEKERIFEMSKRMYDIKKNAAAQSYEPADEVSGVEIYRRPRWYKAVSIAAAFVLAAAAVTGSALMIKGLGNTPEHLGTELEAETEESEPTLTDINEEELTEEEPTEEVLSAELSYDMSTKEGIYNKMLNSIDFFDRASGKYIYGERYDVTNEASLGEFSGDLDAAQSYGKYSFVLLNNPEECISGAPADTVMNQDVRIAEAFIDYSDGNNLYRIFNNFKDLCYIFDPSDEHMKMVKPPQRDRIPYNADDIEAIKDYYYNSGEEFSQSSDYLVQHVRNRGCVSGVVGRGPGASAYAISHLTNFDVWDISGEDTFVGRDCVVIEGIVEKQLLLSRGEASFTMYVDKETGVVVNFYSRNEAGELVNFKVFEELFFDDEAEMVILDLDQYETYVHPEPEDPSIHKMNSKGETYGVAFCAMIQANIDILPDYVRMGDGSYLRTREFLDIFIDGEEAFRTQAELTDVPDTAVAKEVNFYNEEGELLFTRTFYSDPNNIK